MATSHAAEGLGGGAFAGGGVTFLLGDEALIRPKGRSFVVGFGQSFL